MDKKEFTKIRQFLGKTQEKLAEILCVSHKAVQSYEQGWRQIPAYIEKQMILLFSLKSTIDKNIRPCWEIKSCPPEWRFSCIIWELKAKNFCWFLNGTFCLGKTQKNWHDKINVCRQCDVYKTMMSSI